MKTYINRLLAAFQNRRYVEPSLLNCTEDEIINEVDKVLNKSIDDIHDLIKEVRKSKISESYIIVGKLNDLLKIIDENREVITYTDINACVTKNILTKSRKEGKSILEMVSKEIKNN